MDPTTWTVWEQLFRSVAEANSSDWTVKVAAAVVGALLIWILERTWRYFGHLLLPHISEIWRSAGNIKRARAAVSKDGKGIWLANSIPIVAPADYERKIRTSIPIICVANLKGGVGKTTIVANLIAHYSNRKNKRVLAIDLDFQGSLSATALSQANRERLTEEQSAGRLCKAAQLIDDKDAFWLRNCTDQVENVAKARLLPSFYSLASTENRVMVEWLIGQKKDDVRYHLAEILHSNEIQTAFDLILIDAPPRLTTACIQALCASTHVLIPTILDDLSAEAVGAFVDQLRVNLSIWPYLKIAGVVGTMIDRNPVRDGLAIESPLSEYEVDAFVSARDSMALALQTSAPPLRNAEMMPLECFIPQKAELGKAAGHRIAYASPGNSVALTEVRAAFDRLGDELDRRIRD